MVVGGDSVYVCPYVQSSQVWAKTDMWLMWSWLRCHGTTAVSGRSAELPCLHQPVWRWQRSATAWGGTNQQWQGVLTSMLPSFLDVRLYPCDVLSGNSGEASDSHFVACTFRRNSMDLLWLSELLSPSNGSRLVVMLISYKKQKQPPRNKASFPKNNKLPRRK